MKTSVKIYGSFLLMAINLSCSSDNEPNSLPVSQPATAVNDSYLIIQNSGILEISAPGVLQNDSDAEDDLLTAELITSTSNGIVILHTDGRLWYQPDPEFVGSDSFTYLANDGTSDSNIATVTIQVVQASTGNISPVAVDDNYSLPQNEVLYVWTPGILGNDSGEDKQILRAVLVTSTSHGDLSFNESGQIEYRHNPGFLGKDSFTYLTTDGSTNSNIATVNIYVTEGNNQNRAPVAVNDNYSVPKNEVMYLFGNGILGNDNDPDGDNLEAVQITGTSNGNLIFSASGQIEYRPNYGFVGTDSFTYVATDGTHNSNIATVTINVVEGGNMNQPPVAVNDLYFVSKNEGLYLFGNGILGNDTDADGDNLSAIQITGTSNGNLTFSASGQIEYRPNPGFVGTDSFTYKATDGTATSNIATVTFVVRE